MSPEYVRPYVKACTLIGERGWLMEWIARRQALENGFPGQR